MLPPHFYMLEIRVPKRPHPRALPWLRTAARTWVLGRVAHVPNVERNSHWHGHALEGGRSAAAAVAHILPRPGLLLSIVHSTIMYTTVLKWRLRTMAGSCKRRARQMQPCSNGICPASRMLAGEKSAFVGRVQCASKRPGRVTGG